MTREPIAIVGLGGVLPGAATLDEFWNVVERGIDTSSEPPPGLWPLPLDLAYKDCIFTLLSFFVPYCIGDNASGLSTTFQ